MTQEQFKEKIEALALEQDKANASHPYRQTAIAIIEQVLEPHFAPNRGINGNLYYQLEDELVNLLDNYLK
jgi:hypothetical protein